MIGLRRTLAKNFAFIFSLSLISSGLFASEQEEVIAPSVDCSLSTAENPIIFKMDHPVYGGGTQITQEELEPNRIYYACSPATGAAGYFLARPIEQEFEALTWYREYEENPLRDVDLNRPAPRSEQATIDWMSVSSGTLVSPDFFSLEPDRPGQKFQLNIKFERTPDGSLMSGRWIEVIDPVAPIIVRYADRVEHMRENGGLFAYEWKPESSSWMMLPAHRAKGDHVILPSKEFSPGAYQVFDAQEKQGFRWVYLFEFPEEEKVGASWPLALGSVLP